MRISRDNSVLFGPLPVVGLAVVCAVFCPEPAHGQSLANTAVQQSQSIGAQTAVTQPQGITSDGTVLPDSDGSSDYKSVVDSKNSVSVRPMVTPDGMILPGDGSSSSAQGNSDLGDQWVMKHNQKPPPPFTVFADVSVFHTSNVALGHDHELADWFLVATVGASYNRPFANIWNLNMFVSETFFRYDRFNEFDFNNFSAGAAISVQAKQLWGTVWSLHYSFSLLNGRESVGQLFNGHSVGLTTSKAIKLSSADSLVVGLGGAFNIADPSSLQRADIAASATYALALTRHFSVGVTLRESFLAYTAGSRRDFAHSLAVSGRYLVNKWFSLSVSAAGTYNQSNEPAFEYKVLNLGFGLSGNIQF